MKYLKILFCVFGHHDRYALGESEETCAHPLPTDSPEQVLRKFRAMTMLRCRRCPWTYRGGH